VSNIRRITAVLSSALLLQLSLLTSGTLCRMHAGFAGEGAAVSMHGAMAAGMAEGMRGPMHHERGAPADCDAGNQHCGAPWSGGGCAAMGACTVAVSARSDAPVTFTASGIAKTPVIAISRMPAGPAYTPELPPPRA